ncbi:MAG: GDP-mannose 4,6-dehydratase [Gemmataceae bacterium]
MRCVVTGAAGFIGSHLCERLLAEGHDVVGVDAFIPYYPRAVKEGNLTVARADRRFRLAQLDLRADPLGEAVAGAEVIFHLAAMPGLDRSWVDFEGYSGCNLLATQRLLEAVHQAKPPLRRFVHGSTSSVYGLNACGDEAMPTHPVSPYGVTKLAAEQLGRAYADTFGLPLVILRYFSVYGPRQRPDMGYHKFIEALLDDRPITVNGDGHQSRSNTYVADCVEATVAAANAPVGELYNVGGGEAASVWDILARLEKLAGRPARVTQAPARPGDQRQTFADTTRLRTQLGWQPRTPLDAGLAAQWEWQKRLRASSPTP